MPADQKRADAPRQSQSTPRTSAGARGANRGNDARSNSEKQRENQRRLGVGPEHRTEAMKKGHRGTFP